MDRTFVYKVATRNAKIETICVPLIIYGLFVCYSLCVYSIKSPELASVSNF